MLRSAAVFVLLFLAAGTVFGGTPVATVSGSGTFELRGSAVNPDGVPAWPVMAGDVIATGATPVVVEFRDGSRVTLGDKSRAKVEKSGESLAFRLLSGVMEFTLAQQAAVRFFNAGANKPVAAGVGVPTTVSTLIGKTTPPVAPALRPMPKPVSSR